MWAALIAALPSLMQMAGSMMNKSQNDPTSPYKAAGDQYQKYLGEAQNALNPWITAGQGALGNYQNALSPMGNSTGYINNLMNQYQASPWSQFQQQQGMKAMNNAASAGGMAGSGAQMKAAADYSQGLSSRDMQGWLQNNLDVTDRYLSGQSDISKMGLQGANSLSELLGQLAESMGGAAYGAGQAQNNANTDFLGGMMGGASGALAPFMKMFGGGK